MAHGLSSRRIIAALQADGWFLVKVTGDHHQFRHPTRAGKVTVAHPRKDMSLGTVKSIERQSGLSLRGKTR